MTTESFPDTTTSAPLEPHGRALLFTEARTANSFADLTVSDAQLREIWNLAKWPPTAANSQPLRVLYLRTPEGKSRLIEHMNDGNKAKTASAPVVAVLAQDTRYHDHIPAVLPYKPELRDVFEANVAMRGATGEYNAALQAGYFILAVRACGLAAGPMKGFDPQGIDREFFPDGRWNSTLVVNIGHPGDDARYDRLPRLSEDDTLRWA